MVNLNNNDENEQFMQEPQSEESQPEIAASTAPDSEDEEQQSGSIADESPAEDAQASGTSMESVMDLYEESFKRFAEGEVVTGRIISIDRDHVLVDIGYKSEGQIKIHEFRDETGNIGADHARIG